VIVALARTTLCARLAGASRGKSRNLRALQLVGNGAATVCKPFGSLEETVTTTTNAI
jgi:hypothetical protein